jgi:hypothetical protein
MLVTVETPADSWPQQLNLLGRAESGEWSLLDVIPVRPSRRQRQRAPHGQIFFVRQPLPLTAVRIVRRSGTPWTVARIRIWSS